MFTMPEVNNLICVVLPSMILIPAIKYIPTALYITCEGHKLWRDAY
jgi:hypothetical protein